MTDDDARSRNRYFALVAIRLIGSAGAVFGLVLLARAPGITERVLGAAIVMAALAMIAIVPRSLAHRWRTPPE